MQEIQRYAMVIAELLLTEVSRQQSVGQSWIILLQQCQLIWISQEHIPYQCWIILAPWILHSVIRDRLTLLNVADIGNSDGTEVQ